MKFLKVRLSADVLVNGIRFEVMVIDQFYVILENLKYSKN